jgi:hypothetical protein
MLLLSLPSPIAATDQWRQPTVLTTLSGSAVAEEPLPATSPVARFGAGAASKHRHPALQVTTKRLELGIDRGDLPSSPRARSNAQSPNPLVPLQGSNCECRPLGPSELGSPPRGYPHTIKLRFFLRHAPKVTHLYGKTNNRRIHVA